MKNLLIALSLLAFSSTVSAQTNFSVSTKVSQGPDVDDVHQMNSVSGGELTMASEGHYQLSMTVTETDDNKALIKVVFEADNETQTPTLLAEFGEEVGFDVHGTTVYTVITKI